MWAHLKNNYTKTYCGNQKGISLSTAESQVSPSKKKKGIIDKTLNYIRW